MFTMRFALTVGLMVLAAGCGDGSDSPLFSNTMPADSAFQEGDLKVVTKFPQNYENKWMVFREVGMGEARHLTTNMAYANCWSVEVYPKFGEQADGTSERLESHELVCILVPPMAGKYVAATGGSKINAADIYCYIRRGPYKYWIAEVHKIHFQPNGETLAAPLGG